MAMNPSAPPRTVDDPRHWRARAEEARAVAETLTDTRARANVLGIIAVYERLADLAERGPLLEQLKRLDK